MLFRLFTLLAVAALAISTWILSSPAHRPKTTVDTANADLPGYYLKGATLTEYDAGGNPSLRLEAERIDQIDHSTEVALSNVIVRYQAPNGQNWLLTGDTAHVRDDGRLIDVAGNVRLQGESTEHVGTAVVLTDTLTYDVPGSIVTTKADVHIEFGAHTLNARGLIANLKDHTLHLEQKVNGRFQR